MAAWATAGFMASVACEVTVYGPGSATQPVVSVVTTRSVLIKTNCAGRPPQYAPAPWKLTFDLLTVKVASESRVTCATSVPILVLLGLSVLDLSPMYATDRQTSYAHHRLMPPPYGGGGIISKAMYLFLVAELFVFGRILLTPPIYTPLFTATTRLRFNHSRAWNGSRVVVVTTAYK